MYLPPRQLAVRLLLWSALFGYVVWRLSGQELPTALAPGVRSLVPTSRPPAPATMAPAIVDPADLAQALAAAGGAGAVCGATGTTLNVRVGPAGLERAEVVGAVSDEAALCLTVAIWKLNWPRGEQEIETSTPL